MIQLCTDLYHSRADVFVCVRARMKACMHTHCVCCTFNRQHMNVHICTNTHATHTYARTPTHPPTHTHTRPPYYGTNQCIVVSSSKNLSGASSCSRQIAHCSPLFSLRLAGPGNASQAFVGSQAKLRDAFGCRLFEVEARLASWRGSS